MVVMQSQQAWIISQQALSPLKQLTQIPSAVISYLHMPMVKVQQHTMAPFIMQQQLHLELAIMLHMFCSMEQAILSSQLQTIFMPPVHFSIFMVQRGIIIPAIAGLMAGIPALMPIPMPAAIPEVPGFIVDVAIASSPGSCPRIAWPPWPRMIGEVTRPWWIA